MNEKQLRMRINKIQKRAKMESFIEVKPHADAGTG